MECLSHYWQNQLAGKSLVTGLALGVACGYGLFVRYVHVSSVDCDDEAEVTQGAARIFSRLKKIKKFFPYTARTLLSSTVTQELRVAFPRENQQRQSDVT